MEANEVADQLTSGQTVTHILNRVQCVFKIIARRVYCKTDRGKPSRKLIKILIRCSVNKLI